MRFVRLLICLGLFGLSWSVAGAHHSPVAYDTATTITIESEITDFEWANPHVYLFARDVEGNVWTIEAGAPTTLRRMGWLPDTFTPGDRVVITANPGRDPASKIAFLQEIESAGRDLADFSVFAPPPPDAPASSFLADGLAGTWMMTFSPSIRELLLQPQSLPLTAEGSAAVETFVDARDNPGRECVPFAPPLYVLLNGVTEIEDRGDTVLILGEDAAVVRTVHMNAAAAEGVERTVQGHSIGSWEAGVLVVNTTHFLEHRTGNAAGVPSGAEKHLVERFALHPDRTRLIYSFVLEDPEYLAAPVTGEAQWIYRPDIEHTPTECDIESARRYLRSAEQAERASDL